MYVHICRAGASSPSSHARCHAERHTASWRSRDAAGARARRATLLARSRMARPAAARPSSRTSARVMQKLKSHGVMLSVQDGVIEYDCGLIGSKMDCSLESVQDQNLMVMNKRYSPTCNLDILKLSFVDRLVYHLALEPVLVPEVVQICRMYTNA